MSNNVWKLVQGLKAENNQIPTQNSNNFEYDKKAFEEKEKEQIENEKYFTIQGANSEITSQNLRDYIKWCKENQHPISVSMRKTKLSIDLQDTSKMWFSMSNRVNDKYSIVQGTVTIDEDENEIVHSEVKIDSEDREAHYIDEKTSMMKKMKIKREIYVIDGDKIIEKYIFLPKELLSRVDEIEEKPGNEVILRKIKDVNMAIEEIIKNNPQFSFEKTGVIYREIDDTSEKVKDPLEILVNNNGEKAFEETYGDKKENDYYENYSSFFKGKPFRKSEYITNYSDYFGFSKEVEERCIDLYSEIVDAYKDVLIETISKMKNRIKKQEGIISTNNKKKEEEK